MCCEDCLIQTGTSGKLVIAAADPAGYRELQQTTVFDDQPQTYGTELLERLP